MSLNLTGNNLIPYPYAQTTLTTNGITFTDNGDGTITANGTAIADAAFKCWAWGDKVLPSGNYFVSGCPQNGSVNTYYINFAFRYNNVNFKDVRDIGAGALIEARDGIEGIYAVIRIKSGITIESLTFKPMLNKGTTALPYEPYIAPKDVEKVVVAKSPNLIPYPYFTESSTRNGIDWTINEDNSITANGTATGDSYFWCVSSLYFSKGTYTVSGCPEGGATNTFWIGAMSLNSVKEYGEGVTTTAEEEGKTNFYCIVKQGVTVENITFYPMLTKNNNPNIFPYPYQNSSMTQGGLTFTDNRDGTITVNGTSTKAMDFYYWNNRSPLKVNAGENYFVDGCPANGGGSKYYQQIFLYNSSGVSIITFSDTGAGANITVPENAINLGCKIYINSGQTFDNVIFKPRVIKTEVLPYQKYDREVVWNKTSTSDETTDEETTV